MNPKKSEPGNLIQISNKTSGIFSERVWCLKIPKFVSHFSQSLSVTTYGLLLSNRNTWKSSVAIINYQNLYEPIALSMRIFHFYFTVFSRVKKVSVTLQITSLLAPCMPISQLFPILQGEQGICAKESEMILFPTCFPRPLVLLIS